MLQLSHSRLLSGRGPWSITCTRGREPGPPLLLQETQEIVEAAQSSWWELGQITAQDYQPQFRKRTSVHFEGVYVGSKNEFRVLPRDTIVDYQLESMLKKTDD